MIQLPLPFISQMQDILGAEYEDFAASMQEKPPISIRLNPNKPEHEFDLLNPIPWTKMGYYLDTKPSFTLDPYFHAGHYYAQESSSMMLEYIIKQLPIQEDSKVLDLCAAPGGKTTLLCGLLPSSFTIHAHEFHPFRSEILRQNIERWGSPNTIVTSGKLHHLLRTHIQYDLILIDAPCSGEGMFRKEPDAIKQWTGKKIDQCTTNQREILNLAKSLVKPGGYIIYSTCTYNTLENEEMVQEILKDPNYKSISINTDAISGIKIFEYNQGLTYKCFPHRVKGEGFSFSILQNTMSPIEDKKLTNRDPLNHDQNDIVQTYLDILDPYHITKNQEHDWLLPDPISDLYFRLVQSQVKILFAGIPLGHFKGKDWFPNHGLAMSYLLKKNIPTLNLNKLEAIDYLRANNHFSAAINDDVWQIVQYQHANLGWVKCIQGKYKNYLPKHIRIHSL